MAIRNSLYLKSLLLCLCALQPALADAEDTKKPRPAATEASSSTQGTGLTVAEAAAAVQAVDMGSLPAVEPAAAAATVFAKINPRWNKWGLDLIEQHGRKNGWQALPVDSVRIVGMPMGLVGTGFQINLKSGDVQVLSGTQDVPKIRSFKLQSPELEDLKKLLESKPYRDMATESQAIGQNGETVFIESDWQGEYRWRLHSVDKPYPLAEISAIVQKAYARERK